MQQASLDNEAYFIGQRNLLRLPMEPTSFFLWFLMKNRTHSRCYFVEMCAVYLYTLWINTIERRCCIRFVCRISEHR